MKEEARLRMTIDGEPVCEIDIRASYLTIYLAWFNQELDWANDPYDFPGVPREVVKAWFIATFGGKGLQEGNRSQARQRLPAESDQTESY
jgi:hypothetical protein